MACEGRRQGSRRHGGTSIFGKTSDFGIGKKGSQTSPERAHLTSRFTASYRCSRKLISVDHFFLPSRKALLLGTHRIKKETIQHLYFVIGASNGLSPNSQWLNLHPKTKRMSPIRPMTRLRRLTRRR